MPIKTGEGEGYGKKEPTDISELELIDQEIKLKHDLVTKVGKDADKLSGIRATIAKDLKGYGEARDKFEERKNELEKYFSIKEPVIETVIKARKQDIDKQIQQYDDKITKIKTEIQTGWKTDIPKARSDYYATKVDCCTLRHYYEELKTKIEEYQTKIEKTLGDLETEKTEIDKLLSDETNKGPEIYVRLNEFKTELEEIDLKTTDDLAEDFYKKWKEFDNKDNERQDKKQIRDITIGAIKEKKKSCEKLKDDRLSELKKIIAKLPEKSQG